MNYKQGFWYIVGWILGFWCGIVCAEPVDFPRDDTVPWIEWTQSRPDFKSGHGPIIDDLESMSTGLDGRGRPHDMKNVADPGNWVHEMTHLVNAQMRRVVAKGRTEEWNSFYVLNSHAISLPEPPTTLAAIAALIPKSQRDDTYQTYLVQSARYWNGQPFFILDEASAAGNALWYQVSNGKPDNMREHLATKWIVFSDALVAAVEKTDYEKTDRLRAFVKWNNKRLNHLIRLHKQLVDPTKPYQIW